MLIQLPQRVAGLSLLEIVSKLGSVSDHAQIELDFSALRRITTAGMVAIAATVTRWLKEGRSVKLSHLDKCEITPYLQRMDFLQMCGVDLPEQFRRHPSKGRFCPLSLIDHNVEGLGDSIALCLAPGGDDYDHPNAHLYSLSWYVFTEIANNARQHSRGLAYTATQVDKYEGLIRISIADHGMGIRESFIKAGIAEFQGKTDAEAIKHALKPRVTSKGWPNNEGVGLTLVAGLAQELAGWLLVVTGGACLMQIGKREPIIKELPNSKTYQGTLVAAVFARKRVHDFSKALHEAKLKAGLLGPAGNSAVFKP